MQTMLAEGSMQSNHKGTDMSMAINGSRQAQWWGHTALINPEMSITIQKRHSYTENLNSETSGDSQNAFLNYGDASGVYT